MQNHNHAEALATGLIHQSLSWTSNLLFVSIGIFFLHPTNSLATKIDPNKPIWDQDIHLTLDAIIIAGLSRTTESKKIANSANELASFQIAATIPYQPQFESKLSNIHNRNEPQSPTGPTKVEATEASAKISKRWFTGTTSYAELKQTNSSTTLPATGAPGVGGESDNVETSLTLGAFHPLWKNRNGKDLDFEIKKLELLADNTKNQMEQGFQILTMQMVQHYLNAWLAKRNIFLSQQRLAKQQELLRVVKITTSRGTSDESDLLQVQTTMMDLRQNVIEARKSYEDIWRSLLLTLKLDDIYGEGIYKIDPIRIILHLPNSIAKADQICQKKETLDHRNHLQIKGLEKAKKLSYLSIEQAKENDKGELNIEGMIRNNAQTEDNGEGFSDSLSGKNPMWTVALSLKMPLGSAPYDSTYRKELFSIKNLEYQQEQAIDSFKVELENDCFEMYRLREKEASLNKIISLKKKRSEIETRDFQIGRSDVFTVIQTETDLSVTRFQLENLLASRERVAWKILEKGQAVPDIIKSLLKQAGLSTNQKTQG